MTDCQPCINAEKYGWWADPNKSGDPLSKITHCRKCHHTWPLTRTRESHCPTCCAHFTSPAGFDAHLQPVNAKVACRPPAELRDKNGDPVLVQREDSAWMFPPSETDWWAAKPAANSDR